MYEKVYCDCDIKFKRTGSYKNQVSQLYLADCRPHELPDLSQLPVLGKNGYSQFLVEEMLDYLLKKTIARYTGTVTQATIYHCCLS